MTQVVGLSLLERHRRPRILYTMRAPHIQKCSYCRTFWSQMLSYLCTDPEGHTWLHQRLYKLSSRLLEAPNRLSSTHPMVHGHSHGAHGHSHGARGHSHGACDATSPGHGPEYTDVTEHVHGKNCGHVAIVVRALFLYLAAPSPSLDARTRARPPMR